MRIIRLKLLFVNQGPQMVRGPPHHFHERGGPWELSANPYSTSQLGEALLAGKTQLHQ
jgi:hypothetical protein